MTWSAPIWIYLWMAGMAGGAYFAAFLTDRFTGGENKPLLRLATYMGIPLAVIGVLLLVVDLGQPFRFWHLFTQFNVMSPMSLGTWILLLWVIIAVIMVMLWWIGNRQSKAKVGGLEGVTGFLGWVNLVLAVLLMAYTGVLLAVSNQSLWAGTVLLPCLFVVSAISTGVAILILGAITANAISKGSMAELKLALNQIFGTTDWTVSNKMVGRLAEADAIVIGAEIAALIGYVIWLGVSSMAGAGEALRLITIGSPGMAVLFWVGVVILALLIPFVLDLRNWGKDIETKAVWRMVIVSSACAILGGLVLRAVITIGGQM